MTSHSPQQAGKTIRISVLSGRGQTDHVVVTQARLKKNLRKYTQFFDSRSPEWELARQQERESSLGELKEQVRDRGSSVTVRRVKPQSLYVGPVMRGGPSMKRLYWLFLFQLGKWLTKDLIMEIIYADDPNGGPESYAVVSQLVRNLRLVLHPDLAIDTWVGVGYRMRHRDDELR